MELSDLQQQYTSVLVALRGDPSNAEMKTLLNDLGELITLSGGDLPVLEEEEEEAPREEEDASKEEEDFDDMFSTAEEPQQKKQKTGGVVMKDTIVPEVHVDVQNITNYRTLNRFDDLKGYPQLVNNLRNCGFTYPSTVQKHSIPILLDHRRDIMACAQTGSGKTLAFLVPIIAALTTDAKLGKLKRPMSYHKSFPLALVLAPTRELVIQIQEEAEKITNETGYNSIAIYGGADKHKQKTELITHGCDVLIATPGRLVDLLESQKIGLNSLRFFVLDEADRMLDMGFEKDIKKITGRQDFPKDPNRTVQPETSWQKSSLNPNAQKKKETRGDREIQTIMFSATFPKEIRRLASEYLDDYVFLRIGTSGGTSTSIRQNFIYLDESDKQKTVVEQLKTMQGLVLVFAGTKKSADALAWWLHDRKFASTTIHGDLDQRERETALESFRTGKTPILVATDVAARGLDIENVGHVINYDLPTNIEDYVHRIGRTGRAGKQGHAVSFFSSKNSNMARHLVKQLQKSGQEIPQWMSNMTAGNTD
ncbi:hypothetical protein PROFUN_07228 [Planoprotostelium fungivorum]|uniref:RNA helicase n=1 Tax=Planoprotostelium fungivorum TaxID=1890364 RepID=A0A2P6NM42_9EUKA|nr:hypothetical protein PROFUN_07228 [Planoprotostelium fungivorum]